MAALLKRSEVCSIVAGLSFILNATSAFGQCAKLTATDRWAREFGYAVSIDDDSAVIAAPRSHLFCREQGTCPSGAVYAYRREATDWILETTLTPDGSTDPYWFGYGVAVSGGQLVVGIAAPHSGDALDPGSAIVFTHDGPNWVESATLGASDNVSCNAFGTSVDIEGDLIVIGAPTAWSGDVHAPCHDTYPPGAAYVFRRIGADWVEEAKLTAGDGSDADGFGWSAAISSDRIVVGAANANPSRRGASYVFHHDAGSWFQEAKLTSSDPTTGGSFGASVDISGDFIVVGAPYYYGIVSTSGAAYVFRRSGSTWVQIAKLAQSDGEYLDAFASAVAIEGDHIVVGATSEDDDDGVSCGAGAVYEYRWDAVDWRLEREHFAYDREDGDCLGSAVATDRQSVLAAARYDAYGSVYVFDATGADCNCNGTPDISDDCNNNGVPDPTDLLTGADCNNNCTPDECDLVVDCNSTGEVDACDIVEGISPDCNHNVVPDECDLDGETSDDCNANLTPDECELDTDCNDNGVQDICDIAAGTLHDTDGSGFPDECPCDGGTFSLVPVSASGAHTITGNRVSLESAPQRIFLEMHMCGWDPNLDAEPALSCAWAGFDTSGFHNMVPSGDLVYAVQPCTGDDECVAALGNGSTCDYPEPGGGFCDPVFQDSSRPDWPRAGYTIPVGVGGDQEDGFGFAMPACGGCYIFDDGAVKYMGTFALDVPVDAAGTYTISVLPYPDSALVDGSGPPLPLKLVPAVVALPDPIPTASTWGMAVTALLFLSAGTILIQRHRAAFAQSGMNSKPRSRCPVRIHRRSV